MQVFKSQYWRRGVRVSDSTPTIALERKLRHTSVGVSTHQVADMVLDALRRVDSDWTFDVARDTLRFAIWQHLENRARGQVVNYGPLSEARVGLYNRLFEAAVKAAYQALVESGVFS